MALVKCRECGREVSTKAKVCPACGAPLPSGSIIKSLMWMLVWMVIIFVAAALFHSEPDDAPKKVAATTSPAQAQLPAAPASAAASICVKDGDTVTFHGSIGPRTFNLADGSQSTVWIMEATPLQCIDHGRDAVGSIRHEMVSSFQIVGGHPNEGSPRTVKGKLSTNNLTGYYAEPNVIQVAGLDEATKKLGYCIIPKAQYGQYSSYDGGKSVGLLMKSCPAEWLAWMDQCEADGDIRSSCLIKVAIAAQVMLKLFNK